MKRIALLLSLFFLSCLSTKASISLTQSNQISTAATTSTTISLSSTVAAGDLLVCGMMWGNVISGATFTISDTPNGTYTAVSGTPLNDGGPSNSLYIAWVKNGSSQASLTITLAVSGSGSHTIRGGCYDYNSTTGWQSSPVDTQAVLTDSGASGSATPGNITPSATGELIFAAVILAAAPNNNTFAISGTGFTLQEAGATAGAGWGSQTRADGGDNQNSGNTATAPTFSWTGASVHWAVAQVAFKPATAGTGPKGQPIIMSRLQSRSNKETL